ncbi:MAG TPA: glycosyltransferase [Thermoleophilaceae bacterium]|jgi:glycosyltransferase involved in cell wall biosynthesis
MSVSVAMSTHNAERYLEPLLESLARQTRLPDELVAHDDGSEDSTVPLLESFGRSAPFPVRIDRDPVRRGFVFGFLRAAELCEGDLIAFCDADDVWVESKLEVCERALQGSAAWLAMHTVKVVDRELRQIAPDWPAIESTRLVPPLRLTGLHLDAPGLAIVFRRALLAIADVDRRPESRFGAGRQMIHDEFVMFMAGVLGPVQLMAEPLVLYRQHGNNDSGWFERERRMTLTPVLDDYGNAARHTAECARFLESTRSDDPSIAARLAAGAEHYRRAALNWELRTSLYRAGDRRTRARLVSRMVASRAYGSRTAGGFGRLALGKDLVGAIALRQRAV